MIIVLTVSGLLAIVFVLSLVCFSLFQKVDIIKDMVEEDIAAAVLEEINKPLDIPYIKLHPDAKEPTKAHDDDTGEDAGFDLYCLEDVVINSKITRIPTGIAMAIPKGWFGMVVDKSGIASKDIETHGGVIDNVFRGDIQVMLKIGTDAEYKFDKGQKVAQIVILPVPKVKLRLADKLSDTSRGATGFGASGK